MQDRYKKAGAETEKQIEQAKIKILKTCQNLSRLQFPDITELQNRLEERINAVTKELQDFFAERNSLDLISHAWNDADKVSEIVNFFKQNNAVMEARIKMISMLGAKKEKIDIRNQSHQDSRTRRIKMVFENTAI